MYSQFIFERTYKINQKFSFLLLKISFYTLARASFRDDFTVLGTRAIGNIFEHMSRSRKVIVVLTPDYVRDGRNLFELDQASTRFFDQDLEDIIVIKVGAVSPRSVPAQLYTQMRRGQFLEWEGDVHAVQRFKECLKDKLRGERVDLC